MHGLMVTLMVAMMNNCEHCSEAMSILDYYGDMCTKCYNANAGGRKAMEEAEFREDKRVMDLEDAVAWRKAKSRVLGDTIALTEWELKGVASYNRHILSPIKILTGGRILFSEYEIYFLPYNNTRNNGS